jgi:hypothetical protein
MLSSPLEVTQVAKKARLSLYLENEELKRQIKVAAAKRGVAVTDYCAEAIEERLIREGERSIVESKSRNANKERLELLARMDKLRKEIGPLGVPTSELVEQGRRR